MAESPKRVQSMDGGRSLKLFDWFLLPLLSLCNSRRGKADRAQVDNNDSMHSAPIDEQPEDSPPTNYRRMDANCDAMQAVPIDEELEARIPIDCKLEGSSDVSDKGTAQASLIDEQRKAKTPTDFMPDGSGDVTERGLFSLFPPSVSESTISESDPSDSYQESVAPSQLDPDLPHFDLTDLSIGSDFEPPLRSRSIDNIDSSSSDQLKLNDLPLPALLKICEHLKPTKPGAFEMPYKNLYNFRHTCRALAYAVNSFFENPANLPTIEDATFRLEGGRVNIDVSMPGFNYMMHPLRANRAIFKPKTNFLWGVLIAESFDVNDEDMKYASQSLCGPVDTLRLTSRNTTNDDATIFELSRNFTFKTLSCSGRNLTNEIGSRILALLGQQSNAEVGFSYDRCHLSNAPAFLDQVYRSTKSLDVYERDRTDSLFLGISTEFWQKWLLQKLNEGCKIKCNVNRTFTEQTDLSLQGIFIHSIKLRK